MGRNFKPKQVTDKTVEPKAIWGKIIYNKKQVKQSSNEVEITLIEIDASKVFEMWPWLLDEID
jgi:hypothetical protein